MKNRLYLLAVAALLPLGLAANSYEENLDRLEVDNPEFLLHLNLEDDFNVLGNFLSEAYVAYLRSGQQNIPPFPLNFQSLFHRLGLANLKAVTLASEAVAGSGFHNQSLLLFEGAPGGYFLLTGSENRPFTIGSVAPANADIVAEMYFDGPALVEIVRNVLIDLMGEMGQNMIDGQLQQPINEEGMTARDLVDQLRSTIYLAVKADDTAGPASMPAMGLLQGQFTINFSGLAQLMPTLVPFLLQGGFTPQESASGQLWHLNVSQEDMSFDIFVESLDSTGDLLVYLGESSRNWYLDPVATIDSMEEYEDMAGKLPGEGLSFWYTNEKISRWQIENLDSQMPADSPYGPMVAVAKEFLMRFTGSQAGCSFLEGDAYRVEAWQPTSYKSSAAVAALAFPVGMLSAYSMAVQEAEMEAAESEDAGSPAD